MNDFTAYELVPTYSRNKSFYHKANVVEYADGWKALYSYVTLVCAISPDGKIHRFWSGESRTTMKHVHDFMKQHGFGGCDVERWLSMPIEEPIHQRFIPIDTHFKTTYY